MSEESELTHAEQAMAYFADDLSPEERVAFETHLASCAECRALLDAAQQHLPAAEAALATVAGITPTFTPKHTVEEQVARFDAVVRAEAARAAGRSRVARFALAAGIAVILGVAAYMALRPAPARQTMYSPLPPATDGG